MRPAHNSNRSVGITRIATGRKPECAASQRRSNSRMLSASSDTSTTGVTGRIVVGGRNAGGSRAVCAVVEIVKVVDPEVAPAPMLVGLNDAVAFVGKFEAEKVTADESA